jgi:uncharacterized protein DUF6263
MSRRCWLLGYMLIGLCVGPAHGQTKLSWRFDEGEKFWIETSHSTRDALSLKSAGGGDSSQNTERTTLTSFTVRKKNTDGSVVIEQKIESVKVTIQGTLQKPDASLSQLLEGAVFRLTLSPKMELKQFEGYEAVAAKATLQNPELGRLFRTSYPEEVMRRAVDEAFGFLPDHEVKTGQKWNRKLVLTLGPLGVLSGLNNFTYRGYSEGKEKIDVESVLTYVPPPQTTDFVFQKGDLKAENVRGTILFDPQNGKLAQSEIKLKLKGALTIAVAGMLRSFEYDQEQTIRTRFLDKPPQK